MVPLWVHLAGVLALIAVVALTFHLMRNRMPLSPRQVLRHNRWTTPFMGAVFLAIAAMNWSKGQHFSAGFMALMALIMLASTLAAHLRSPRPLEALQNFAVEPSRCGQCEYDLTGNVSGVCPECGWQIPRGELDVDSPGWAIWWRKWEIARLRNWRRTLALLGVMMSVFGVMGVVMAIWLGPPAAAMPVMMSAFFGINVWRVIAYGRKQRQHTALNSRHRRKPARTVI